MFCLREVIEQDADGSPSLFACPIVPASALRSNALARPLSLPISARSAAWPASSAGISIGKAKAAMLDRAGMLIRIAKRPAEARVGF